MMHSRYRMGGFWLAAGMAFAAPAQAQDDQTALFQARYTELRSAIQANDTAAARAILAPGYELTDILGNVSDTGTMLDRTGRSPVNASRKTTSEVRSAAVDGLLATVEQKLSASVTRPGSAGVMELEVASTDTWVKQGDSWLLWRSKQTELTVKRDGAVMFSQKN